MNSPTVKHISECFIKPKYEVKDSEQPYYLSPWDINLLGINYIQKGLLFLKPTSNHEPIFSMNPFLESLKDSLSSTLVHFYPLAGQLSTILDHNGHRSLVFVDCTKGPGIRFLHADIDTKVSDILSPTGCFPLVVKYLFDQSNGELSHDGHWKPLLTVQVTELVDGIFIGCSMNHVIADGTSFWHFWNAWSETHRWKDKFPFSISRPPFHQRWVPEGYDTKDIFLPYIDPKEFIRRSESPTQNTLRERVFHFSSENVTAIKARVIEDVRHMGQTSKIISSFQALIALVWRSIIQANKGINNPSQVSLCKLAVNDRIRLDPPLPQEYFGNAVTVAVAKAQVSDLLNHGIGWAALLLNQAVSNHTEEAVNSFFHQWFESPSVINLDGLHEVKDVVFVGSSPRFQVYENRFDGVGKPVAVRSGCANKYGGKVTAFPGCEGEGIVDLEICLPVDAMNALELDKELMAYVSVPFGSH